MSANQVILYLLLVGFRRAYSTGMGEIVVAMGEIVVGLLWK